MDGALFGLNLGQDRVWVSNAHQSAHRKASKPLCFGFPTRSSQRGQSRWARNFGVISVCDDQPGTFGHECCAMERSNVEPSWDSPEKAVTIVEIFGPLLITQKISPRTFDFDNDDLTLGAKAHQIGTTIVAKTDFGLDHDLVA
jgi:hypothetical protein